jgi:two-component system cell cycle sensor histidine kinase/response regulator CckA
MSERRNVVIKVCCKVVLVVALILAIFGNAAASRDQKKVLLISSYHPGFPTFFQQIAGIKSTFDPLTIDLDIEFMDSKRFYSPENLNNFYNSLHYKLSRAENYDVIMTADDNALSFALTHKQALFDKAPIVFFGVNSVENAVAQNSNPDVTGIVEAVSMRETVELMIKLHPNISKIIALVDGTPSGQGDLKTFYGLQPVFKSVVFSEISLARCTFEEFAAQLRKIDENSVVLLLSAYRDKNDQTRDFHQSILLIRSNMSRPVYHLWDHGIGDGLLGGKIISHYHLAKQAAELVADILDGKDPKDIPVLTESPNQYKFDYNALKRFNIKLAALPSERTIINFPDTFYTRHKSVLRVGFGVIIGFSVVVLILSINILRRKRAERDLQKAHDELDQKVRDRTV